MLYSDWIPDVNRGLSSNNNSMFFTKVQTNFDGVGIKQAKHTLFEEGNAIDSSPGKKTSKQAKRTLFKEGNAADSSSAKKGRRDNNDKSRNISETLVSVKTEKKGNSGASAVEVGEIIRACYGTKNAETIVGDQACTLC